MASQTLEQMLELVPRIKQERKYQTIDVYTPGTTALYSGKPLDPPGFGKDFGLGTGYVYDKLTVDGHDLYFRIRADAPHRGMNVYHLNIETIYDNGNRKPIIDNIHEPFDWKK